MARYLIEVHHTDDYHGCKKALRSILRNGSHFVTQADWGCDDGVHTGWLIADVEDRNIARMIVPPELRPDARIVELSHWTRRQIADRLLEVEAATSSDRLMAVHA